MKYHHTIVLLSIFLGIPPSHGRTHQADDTLTKKWILMQTTSPLRITVSPNGEDYHVDNYSTRRIVAYRLGCVVENKDKISVKRKSKRKLVDIWPLDMKQGTRYSRAFTVYADRDFYPCIERKIKLAVLEVWFSDGSKWRIGGAATEAHLPQ